jgi:hypothetical protein
VYQGRLPRQRIAWDRVWNGPVSIDADGTVLAIHAVDIQSLVRKPGS